MYNFLIKRRVREYFRILIANKTKEKRRLVSISDIYTCLENIRYVRLDINHSKRNLPHDRDDPKLMVLTHEFGF